MGVSKDKISQSTETKLGNNFRSSEISLFDKYSDAEIWDKFRNGDRSAFAYVYNSYTQAIYNFGCQFTTDKELVKDTLHDLFVGLRKPGKQAKILSIKSYLFKCFYRDLIKKINKIKRNQYMAEFDTFQVVLSPEHLFIDQQHKEFNTKRLNGALEALSYKQRQALTLFYYEEMSYTEIAEVFDMDHVKSARKLVYRAIDRLKALLSV